MNPMTDENRDRGDRAGKRPYHKRDSADDKQRYGRDGYRPRGDRGNRDGERRSFSRDRDSGNGRGRDRHDRRDSDCNGERKPFGHDRPRYDNRGSDRPGRDGERKSFDRDRPRYNHRDSERDGGRKSFSHDGDRPRYNHRDSDRDGERKPFNHDRRDGDRPRYNRRDSRDGERKSFRPRDGKRKSFSRGGDRPRFDNRRNNESESNNSEEYTERKQEESRPRDDRKIRYPSDPQKLLFRGVDYQANGRNDLALIMYLHGAVLMSKGCENNASIMLRDLGKENFTDKREQIADRCSEDALIEYDYICRTLNEDYDCSFFESKYSDGNKHAIYCKIRLEEVEGEDPIIDTFVLNCDDNDQKVIEGLKLLKRKKDSVKATENLARIDENKKLRQSIHTKFEHAMKGNVSCKKDLERLSSRFPEAAFFLEYMENREKGTGLEWLKSKYDNFKELMISEEYHLDIKDTPFGLFLRAKNLQAKKEDWIPQMIKAAKAGSDEALDELKPLKYRGDIERSIAEVYLARKDLDGLLSMYKEGFEDTMYLEKYCQSDRSLILKVGEELGAWSTEKEIDWYRVNARNGYTECRNELINRMHNKNYRSKALIYALHDVGADPEAARLYLEMEASGEDQIPALKWLRKVCDNEAAKDFLHDHYEEKGDLATFESIFVDDGYRKKSFPRGPKGKGRRNSRK